jgi:hypothetical protein
MRKALALAAVLAGLGAVGCTGTTPGGRQWAADPDKPPPIQTSARPAAGPTELDPVKLPATHTRVSAEDIDETNYQDSLRRLESETKVEKRALSQAK